MTTPKSLRALAEAIAASADGGLDENASRLSISGRPTVAQLEQLRQVNIALPTHGILSIAALDELGDPVDVQWLDAARAGQRFRFVVEKRCSKGAATFFTVKGLSAFLVSADFATGTSRVFVAADFAAFSTEGCAFAEWVGEVKGDPLAVNEAVFAGPRKMVKDLIGGQVPVSIGPFLLKGAEPVSSEIYTAWRNVACRQMLLSMANEVWLDEQVEKVSLTGPRTRRLASAATAPFDDATFLAATEACGWVYLTGRDVEVRHTMLTYELAREWPEDISWRDGFAARGGRALESAKTCFQAHVRETSKDTLKSLGELRKALNEEVAKVVGQTRELLSTMWRDFLVAAVAFMARLALLFGDKVGGDPAPARVLLVSAIAFLLFSLILTWRSNAKFMSIAEESRAAWRTKLYGFLPVADLKDLADEPLAEAEATYRNVRNWVAAAYFLMVITLAATAYGLGNPLIPTAKNDSSGANQVAGQASSATRDPAASSPAVAATAPSAPPSPHRSGSSAQPAKRP